MNKRLRDLIILHEALKLKPYRCTKGKLTIGVGRNLDDFGISYDEAMTLLENDVIKVMGFLSKFRWFTLMNEARQSAMIDFVFNLGPGKFLEFKKTIALLESGDYVSASKEMMDSEWAKEVKGRADHITTMMRTGLYL